MGIALEIERLTAPKAQGIPIDRARFWEVDKVKHALRVEIRAGIFRAGEYEPTTANLTQAFTGLLGHGVNQFEVTHEMGSPRKGMKHETRTRNTNAKSPGSQKGRTGK